MNGIVCVHNIYKFPFGDIAGERWVEVCIQEGGACNRRACAYEGAGWLKILTRWCLTALMAKKAKA